MMFTNEQINEIEAMCEKATHGPFTIEPNYPREVFSVFTSEDEKYIGEFEKEEDLYFFSAARTLLPALAADYKAMAAENERLRAVVGAAERTVVWLRQHGWKTADTPISTLTRLLISTGYPCLKEQEQALSAIGGE